LENVVGRLKTSAAGFRSVSGDFGVGKDQSANLGAVAPPEFEEDISANRNTSEDGARDFSVAAYGGHVRGMLLHGGRAIAGRGGAVSAKVRQDETVALRESLSYRKPEGVTRGEWMEQDHIRALPHDGVKDVSAFVMNLHATILLARRIYV
jgi:hypothetical protein